MIAFRRDLGAGGNLDMTSGVPKEVDDGRDSEQHLLERARGGDILAYGELVRIHQETAFRTAYVLTRSASDSEEAVQDAFVKAWAALGRFRAGAAFRPWLTTIVANEARTRTRAGARRDAWTKRAAEDARLTRTDIAPSAEATVLVRERSARLRGALDRLSERDRSVIELRCLLELSERETAAALGCRPGTVKSRLSRALVRLRDQLEERP